MKSLAHRLFYNMKSNLYVFTMKCVLITNISIEHYVEGVIRSQKTKQVENEKQTLFKSSFSIVHTKVLYMTK